MSPISAVEAVTDKLNGAIYCGDPKRWDSCVKLAEEIVGMVVVQRVAALTDAQLAKIVWYSVDIAELYDTDSVDVSTLRAALLTALGGNTK